MLRGGSGIAVATTMLFDSFPMIKSNEMGHRSNALLARTSAQTVFPHLETEPFLAALVRSSDDAIIGKTTTGIVVLWNEAAEALYGYKADEMIGCDIALLIPPDRPDELPAILHRVQSGFTVRHLQTERLRKDGTTVAVSLTVTPVIDACGAVLGMSTIAHDLTLHNRQLAELRDAHRRSDETLSTLETLHGSAPVGLGFVDREFRIIHLNEMLAAVNGSTVKDQLGKTVAESIPGIWPQIEPAFRHVLENDESVLNIETSGEIAAEPGHQRHWLASYYPVHLDTEVIGVGIVVVDITERRQAEDFRSTVMNNMAEGLVTVDAQGLLTSMNNAASRMLGWTEAELLGKVMENYILDQGHGGESIEEGNRELLKVRSEGRTVHLDDHAYLCKNGSALAVAISASPLIAGASLDGAVIVFRDITDEKSERRRVKRELAALTWVGRIREALDEERLVLYSQPIVPLNGGQASEELLLRMVARNGDLILPDAFLGVAERYGLITEIDQWVVKQAVRLAASGRHVGANLSAESIVTMDLLAIIRQELEQTGAEPSNLVFEITETALMRDIEKGHSFAHGVVELGCGIALDDFGTGFGTFTHVKKLAIKYLKIDIEFVRGLVGSTANQHVVKAIVNLAQGFGCETIAEGVGDDEALKLLRDYGVDFGQGFHLGRPAPLGQSEDGALGGACHASSRCDGPG
jgi:PAS domain S-box-containing protein